MKRHFFTLCILCVLTAINYAQTAVPFSKGVNLTGWFQASSPHGVQYTKYSREDFENIASLGADVVRLPVNLHYMGIDQVDYRLDSLFLRFLDSAVTWADDNNLNLIIDNHTLGPSGDTDPTIEIPLKKVWLQLAERYKDQGPNLFYEIMNEPHGIADNTWGQIQKNVIEEIRSVDGTHTLIVGGANWNSYNNLDEIPDLGDTNLIYTFHFYDPFLFTHQGANWTNPSMESLAGIPFPYDPATMPDVPPELAGTWVADNMNYSYPTDGTVEKVKEWLDIAIDFSGNNNVPVYCGEFGVYDKASDPQQRITWFDTVSSYLSVHQVPWTIWDYQGGFGLFEKDSYGAFDYDLNIPLVTALGFEAPPQRVYIKTPDSAGFIIYDDFIARGFSNQSYLADEKYDFYCTELPNNQDYCLLIRDASQYTAVQLRFGRVRDLSYLKENGFALDFIFRGDSSGVGFDIRFIDTDTGDVDRPWRCRYSFSPSNITYDNGWHHVHIPLADFTEHGAYDEEGWHNPEGLFDWTEIDVMEIAAEYGDFSGTEIWFDNIHITDQDTARIFETGYAGYTGPLSVIRNTDPSLADISITPDGNLFVQVQGRDTVLITDISGRIHFYDTVAGTTQINLESLPSGLYFVKIGNSVFRFVRYK